MLVSCSEAVFLDADDESLTYTVDEANEQINQIMKSSGLVGVSAVVLDKSNILWSKGYGVEDVENEIPFTEHSIINIGSISKSVTATAMLMLVDKGLCDLEDDINDYLSFNVVNPHCPDGVIHIRDLLTHTSGISDREDYYDLAYTNIGTVFSLQDYLSAYLTPQGGEYNEDNFSAFCGGQSFHYSKYRFWFGRSPSKGNFRSGFS